MSLPLRPVAGNVAILAIFAACSSSVSAQIETNSQKNSVSRFDDWELVCQITVLGTAPEENTQSKLDIPPGNPKSSEIPARPPSASDGGGAAKSCKLVQRLTVKETGQTVFMTSVLPAAKKGQFVSIISAPMGGYLAPGMELRVDKGRAYKVLFETCNTSGCHGGFEMTGQVLEQFRKGREANVRLWTTKSKPADVKISLAGFPKAFAALKEAAK